MVMTARIQLGWVDPADLVTEEDAAEGEEAEVAAATSEETGA